jgi:hypothetical protein
MSAANSIGEHPVPERPNPGDLAGGRSERVRRGRKLALGVARGLG